MSDADAAEENCAQWPKLSSVYISDKLVISVMAYLLAGCLSDAGPRQSGHPRVWPRMTPCEGG